jgi:AcrR family transcriptional regulator
LSKIERPFVLFVRAVTEESFPSLASSLEASPLGGRSALGARSVSPKVKGLQTRAVILDAALSLAAQRGLEGLSIGSLADAIQMSKSGVFAHFGSREELQISVVREYHARFREEVFVPAMAEPRGLPRLLALFERWVRRVSVEIDSGCIYISGAVEFDDRPGPVRDGLVDMVLAWQEALERAIRLSLEQGHLQAGCDPHQILFEVHGLILALHHDARFLRHADAVERARRAFSRILAHVATPAGLASISPASAGSPAQGDNALGFD